MANGSPDQPANAPTPTSSPAAQPQPAAPAAGAPATTAPAAAGSQAKAAAQTPAQGGPDAPSNPPGAGRPASSVVTPAAAADVGDWPRYKTEPPASGFRWQGIDVGADFTPVPPRRAGQLLSAAARAGVTLTAEA